MLALMEEQEDIVLGKTEVNASKFYGKPECTVPLPVRGDFFTLHAKCSVIDAEGIPDDIGELKDKVNAF